MNEVMSEDVLDWARDLAAIRDLLSTARCGDRRMMFGASADRASPHTPGVVVLFTRPSQVEPAI